MPYVLSAALVLILGEYRQAHIRLGDLCTPHQSHSSVSFPWMGGSVTEERRTLACVHTPAPLPQVVLRWPSTGCCGCSACL